MEDTIDGLLESVITRVCFLMKESPMMLFKRLSYVVIAVSSLLLTGEAMAEYADVVLADNPVLYYQFEQAGGAVNSGSAGSTYDGIYNGTLVLGTGCGRVGGPCSTAWTIMSRCPTRPPSWAEQLSWD